MYLIVSNQSSFMSACSISDKKDGSSGDITEKPKVETETRLKICCACPDTKKVRDEFAYGFLFGVLCRCMFKKGEEYCSKEIKEHLECLRKLGFKVCFCFVCVET